MTIDRARLRYKRGTLALGAGALGLTAAVLGGEVVRIWRRGTTPHPGETVGVLDTTLKDVRIPRANLGPCPVCGNDIVENRKGYSCWSREDPGCGFVIWKSKAGKQLPVAIARELIAHGFTARPVTGFKGRSGRSFRAKLALEQGGDEDARWRVEFDEPWAKEGAKPPETVEAAEEAVPAGADEGAAAA